MAAVLSCTVLLPALVLLVEVCSLAFEFTQVSRYLKDLRGTEERALKSRSEIINVVLLERLVATLNRFSDRAKVRLNDKEGYIDTDGREICPIKYDETDIFSDGLASVCIDGKWGFINTEGEEVIPLMYDEVIRMFHKGFAVVRIGEKKLAINELGYIVKKL